VITPTNDPPVFSLSSSVNITLDENCANCASTTIENCTYPFILDSYVIDVLPSAANLSDERAQVLTFEMSFVDGDLSIFQIGHSPSIDPSTGQLTFCLQEDRNGDALFSFILRDDNGTDCGGLDSTPSFHMTVTVLPVNQPPSYEICCDKNLVVWEGEKDRHIFEDFIVNMRKGNLDVNLGVDSEADQQVSFDVILASFWIAGNVHSHTFEIFTSPPAINSSGTLEFSLSRGTTGTASLALVMTDDGGRMASIDRSCSTSTSLWSTRMC